MRFYFLSTKKIFALGMFIVFWPMGLVQAKNRLVRKTLAALEKNQPFVAQKFIEQAVANEKINKKGQTWYCRGVVYEALSKKAVAVDSIACFLNEALVSYDKTRSLTKKKSQYHSFAKMRCEALWAYHLNRGVRYYRREIYDRAIESYDFCKQIQPNDSLVYLYTGIAAHQDTTYTLAIENYERYFTIGKSPEVYYGLASIIQKHQKAPQKALDLLQEALEKYPWNSTLLHAAVQLLKKLNQAEAQAKQLQEKIAEDSTHSAYCYHLAYLYENLDKPKEAMAYYTRALALSPNKVAPNLQLGIIFYNQASAHIHKAVAMPEATFQAHGKAAFEVINHDLHQALPFFEKANTAKPNDLLILEGLQHLYTHLHMEEKSKALQKIINKVKN